MDAAAAAADWTGEWTRGADEAAEALWAEWGEA